MLIWIIIEKEDNRPIIAASSREKAEQQLFDYMGWGNPDHADTVKYLGFTPMVYSEFEDDFVGAYKFSSYFPSGWGNNITYAWEEQTYYLYLMRLDANQK